MVKQVPKSLFLLFVQSCLAVVQDHRLSFFDPSFMVCTYGEAMEPFNPRGCTRRRGGV